MIKKVNIKTHKNVNSDLFFYRTVWLNSLARKSMLTKHTFECLLISKGMILKILEFSYTHMTRIQNVSIPFQICGFDLLGSGRTGSGKTIAFSLPLIEFINIVKWQKIGGTAAIILSPTRELTMQSYFVIKDLIEYHSHSYGIIMGGANKKTEGEKIKKGISILIATPGRLLDHLKNTKNFIYSNLQILVVDEADRCLEIGFEEEIYEIIRLLPKDRQTILFSATQTKNVDYLSKISFKKKPIYIGVDDTLNLNIIPEIDQSFIVCKPENKFIFLLSLIKKKKK